MSEVIVRMEKVPKNCDDSCWGELSGECPWSVHIDGYTMDGGRPRNCPIICEVPDKHGDLVDFNDVLKELRKYGYIVKDEITGIQHMEYPIVLEQNPIRIPTIVPRYGKEQNDE